MLGRKKKYFTDEARKKANARAAKKYYEGKSSISAITRLGNEWWLTYESNKHEKNFIEYYNNSIKSGKYDDIIESIVHISNGVSAIIAETTSELIAMDYIENNLQIESVFDILKMSVMHKFAKMIKGDKI